MTTLKAIEKVCENFNNDDLLLIKELKRIQSIKCRLKKQKGKSSYEKEMTEIIKQEQVLKEARQLLNPSEKTVTTFNQSDIDQLDYDQTVKAIRSIQSKKTLTKWLTDIECDNDEYRAAVAIEQMLIARRESIKPVDNDWIRKSELQAVINGILDAGSVSQDRIIKMLQELL